MSYDLSFYKPAGKPFSLGKLEAFFRGNELFQVSGDISESMQFFYENEATGAYFSFDFYASSMREPSEYEGYQPTGLSFNVNYCRPCYFIHEAVLPMAELMQTFGLFMVDPQGKGEVEPFDAQIVTDGWEKSNEWATKAMSKMGNQSGVFMPKEEILRWWRYTYYAKPILDEDAAFDFMVFNPSMWLFYDAENERARLGYLFQPSLRMTIPEGVEVCLMADMETDPTGGGIVSAERALELMADSLEKETFVYPPDNEERPLTIYDNEKYPEVLTLFNAEDSVDPQSMPLLKGTQVIEVQV
ncbi:MAG: hypothetical protein AAF570_17650 [Bacteroidota bacterium]